VEEALD
jgi:hypothetical protein